MGWGSPDDCLDFQVFIRQQNTTSEERNGAELFPESGWHATLFHRECWHFFFFEWKFLRVILEDSSIHSVEHLEIL